MLKILFHDILTGVGEDPIRAKEGLIKADEALK